MNFSVDANGFEEEHRSHISLYVYRDGSNHGNNLVWPFRDTVIMQVLNKLDWKTG